MDISSIGRGHAIAVIDMDRRTREGEGTYTHTVPGEETMFGTWRVKVVNFDEIHVTTKYAVYGGPEEVQPHIWRRLPPDAKGLAPPD
jgi:hypothetical protein